MGFNVISGYLSGGSGAASALSGGGGFRPSIVLFDIIPGTRNTTLLAGVYRIRGGGAGGGSHGTPGLAVGGSTSWNAVFTATGGAARSAGGVGSGGLINTSGGSTAAAALQCGGGASGHRLGSSPLKTSGLAGSGWTTVGDDQSPGFGAIDGMGLGINPGAAMAMGWFRPTGAGSVATSADLYSGLYGGGGMQMSTVSSSEIDIRPGLGGGGGGLLAGTGLDQHGGPCGGGAGGNGSSYYPGSGGGFFEGEIIVASSTVFPYTVGAPGAGTGKNGGCGYIIVEKIA